MSKNDDRRGAPHGIQRLCLAMAMIAGFAVTTASCSSSVTTGGTSSTGTSSSTGAGTCTGSCTKNADCSGQGPLIVCRACQCVNLTTELCTTIYTTGAQEEALADDNALYLGSILPTSGFDLDFGLIVQDAIKLAISDFAQGGGIPLPGGTGTRPIVLVGCSDGPNEDEYQAAAKHLVNDVGVQAIIGHAFSGATIQIATDVTIPAGVLLFSPTASSDDISTLVDNDLVWRAATPDSFQGTALASYYPEVAARAQQHYPAIPGGPLKVAVIHNDDAYGKGITDKLLKSLIMNGQPSETIQIFQQANLNALVAGVVAYAPHVVFVFGFNEGPDVVLPEIEGQWVVQADGHRPMWVFSDGALTPTLWKEDLPTDDLRQRVTGSLPSSDSPGGAGTAFKKHWGGSVPATTYGVPNAYDITYLLAYSAVAVGDKPLTGANLVSLGLRRMLPGPGIPSVEIGPAGIPGALAKLSAGQMIDVDGASGSLDFDEQGSAYSNIKIWCVPPGIGGNIAGPAMDSGRYYSVTQHAMAGSFSATCGLP